MALDYSFVIPVYNRPGEVRELLESMLQLKFSRNFEIVIIEDGSTDTSQQIVEKFQDRLDISYYFKSNSGPGDSRNFGMKKAKGDYCLILDSDVLLPQNYLQEVDNFLQENYCDCFGGPDASHPSFSNTQKAIDYSMTSFLTTGGIRGRKSSVNDFQPRSFNMGISQKAFEASGGFGQIHPGEDPDLSLRLKKLGFKLCLIPNAVVFHKRRIDWSKFYIQVKKFGLVRPILNKWHRGSAKITYWFPTVFTFGLLFAILLLKLGFWWLFLIYVLYFMLIATHAAVKNRSLRIGFMAVYATLVQFLGYGYGFIKSVWYIQILKQDPKLKFPNLFFKNV
ncbi:Glycosyltransferase, catalytic subunit of cellulose synthase and poly-beta-1,6-N-acetylglucosamine synthase [Salegentibacter holothuriorum]|uniref:Glycosyltransferase, catalytic subunit of cellulose synthase and poly-beta-1,6-N-acetylglucosamine synthase n=1 Tax=Salegentibacter holothuriorum TaxID=241145 RepID=A0A1T5B043_9FLAO|nr:glycosyltransferase [Salegentibacter holothuriorum]SKB40592.1 Glycosyltransferase, catalytic subunit of cellulose synthase and poly-beta-1,6-N-acetylglucosamine synthase [Salegentibacter holothuriorum]